MNLDEHWPAWRRARSRPGRSPKTAGPTASGGSWKCQCRRAISAPASSRFNNPAMTDLPLLALSRVKKPVIPLSTGSVGCYVGFGCSVVWWRFF